MNRNPILFVEDDSKDVGLAEAAFRETEFTEEVIIVRDGQEALDFLRREGVYQGRNPFNPAVVLMDIKLPKVNGLEVLKQIKSDPQLADVPVVMLTSSREEADRATSYEFGANAYVVKPLGIQELFDTIKSLGLSWAMLKQTPSKHL